MFRGQQYKNYSIKGKQKKEINVQLTCKLKLLPNSAECKTLLETIFLCNSCCNWLAEQSWQRRVFRQYDIHYAFYYDARKQFPKLSSQAILHCEAKVADAYKASKKIKPEFKESGAVTYDWALLSWKNNFVSIWTIEGRKKLHFVCGQHQRDLLKFPHDFAKLLFQNKKFYLLTCCKLPDVKIEKADSFLGVDLGIENIAWDSDNNSYSGKKVNNVRYRHRRLRQKLQKANSKSAKRHLKKLSGKERRFASDINHSITKKILKLAKGTNRGIAIEDLKGIRDRITVRKKHRARQNSWSFFQFRTFLEYKSALAGVELKTIPAYYTSQECSECHYIHKKNRKTRNEFVCLRCNYAASADYNAARVISSRATIIKPIVTKSLELQAK